MRRLPDTALIRPIAMTLLLAAPPGAAQAAGDPVAAARCAGDPLAFGCANAANLAAMAAPDDLRAGRTLAPADGAVEAAAVQRLRADKVKDLAREGSTAGGSPQ